MVVEVAVALGLAAAPIVDVPLTVVVFFTVVVVVVVVVPMVFGRAAATVEVVLVLVALLDTSPVVAVVGFLAAVAAAVVGFVALLRRELVAANDVLVEAVKREGVVFGAIPLGVVAVFPAAGNLGDAAAVRDAIVEGTVFFSTSGDERVVVAGDGLPRVLDAATEGDLMGVLAADETRDGVVRVAAAGLALTPRVAGVFGFCVVTSRLAGVGVFLAAAAEGVFDLVTAATAATAPTAATAAVAATTGVTISSLLGSTGATL